MSRRPFVFASYSPATAWHTASAVEGAMVVDQPPKEMLKPFNRSNKEGESTTRTKTRAHRSPVDNSTVRRTGATDGTGIADESTGGGDDVVLLENKEEKSIELSAVEGRKRTAAEGEESEENKSVKVTCWGRTFTHQELKFFIS